MTSVSGGMSQTSSDARYQLIRPVQNATPTTGQTVTMTSDSLDGSLNLTPAGTMATLTITLPSEANSHIGQVRRVNCTQAVTLLTMAGASSLLGMPTAIVINTGFSVEKIAANTWIRQ